MSWTATDIAATVQGRLEGEGVGTDVVRASVSYALAAGSQIEMLRTTNDKGKGSIEIPFDSTEEFERVFALITGREASEVVG